MIKKIILVSVACMCCMMVFAQAIQVMSYNIRYRNTSDGVNSWSKRKENVAGLIRKYQPDIIGTQEALHSQYRYLKCRLKKYAAYGVGRNNGRCGGEYAAIFFNKKTFKKVKTGNFWLSLTPEIPGSKSWDAALTRIVTWCELTHVPSGKVIFVFNTHFDHIGKKAREKSALLIIDSIKAITGNNDFILTGDLNTEPHEEAYQNLMNEKDNLFTDAAGKNNTEGTFCGFEVKNTNCKRIDYILCSKKSVTKNYRVIHDNNGTFYPSDHMPVMAEIGF